MKIELQSISLLLSVIIVVMWAVNKKFDCYSSKYFNFVCVALLLSNVCSFIFSLLSLNLFEITTNIFLIIFKLSSILNLILIFITCTYIFAKFTSDDNHKKIIFPMSAIPLVESILILILPISINKDMLIGGNCVLAIYVCVIIYVLLDLIILMTNNNKNKLLETIAVIFSVFCYLVGVAIEYFTNINGLICLCSTIAVGGCMLLLDNPFNKTNSEYKCFNCGYLNNYINDYYVNNKRGFCAYVTLTSKNMSIENDEKISLFKKELIKQLNTVPELTTFLTFEKDIFTICNDTKLFDDFVEDLKEDVETIKKILDVDNSFKSVIVFGKDILVASNSANIYRHMHIMANRGLTSYKSHSVLFLNEKFINLQENEENVRKLIVDALNNDRIEAYYQPIYAPKRSKFTSAEALVRIRDEEGNVILPKYFIKTAENTGLITEIGLKMFEKVCILLTSPKMKDISLDNIDINLSLVECENPKLADNLIKIAKKYQIEPSMISFDITEANLEIVYENMFKNINKLHKYGFKLALDDFGTRETRLNYLLDTPISCVKIDRHVVWDYFDNYKTRIIVDNLIKLCANLGIEVSATGIEKITQLNEMSHQNVDYIQGYYFFKPMPEGEYMKFLKPNAFQAGELASKFQNIEIISEN